jgi:hypothetical protein|tara:strand:- start:245 stop:370 length:126 start_codon:yes stop_codon:yes gene_type:complete
MTKEICGIFLGKELEAIFFPEGEKGKLGERESLCPPTYIPA